MTVVTSSALLYTHPISNLGGAHEAHDQVDVGVGLR